MSDGMSDGAALGRLEAELDDAAHDFAKALRAAVVGCRGWVIRPDLNEIDRQLRHSGYELHRVGSANPNYAKIPPSIGERHRAFAKRLLDATRPITRWPCPECGRPSADTPLRLVGRTLEDGQRIRGGCVLCATLEPLWALADAILAGEDLP